MLRYDIFYLAGALLASPVLLARTLRTGKWRTDWKARFGHVAPLDGLQAGSTVTGDATGGTRLAPRVRAGVGSRPDLPTVLVHGVSVGEVAATRGLVERLAGRARVVVSSTTDTGVERARSLYGGRHPVVRYPFDLSWMVRRFLDAVRPDAVALAELEVWPNFVSECTRRGIPVCVVNGRLSTSSYRGYQRARRWVRPVFRQLAAVGAQNEVYARRFVELGTPPARVQVTDTMKWDTSGRPRTGPRVEQLAAALGIDRTRPLIVAGSTGPGEEEELIATRPPAAQLLLVPRRPERFDAVAALRPEIRRRSRCDAPPDSRPPAPRPAEAAPTPPPTSSCSTPWASWSWRTPSRMSRSWAGASYRWAGRTPFLRSPPDVRPSSAPTTRTSRKWSRRFRRAGESSSRPRPWRKRRACWRTPTLVGRWRNAASG